MGGPGILKSWEIDKLLKGHAPEMLGRVGGPGILKSGEIDKLLEGHAPEILGRVSCPHSPGTKQNYGKLTANS